MPHPPQRKADSRQRILAAAGTAFRRRGYAATAVAEVMHAAGLTRGGFYRHFADKAALYAAALAGLDPEPQPPAALLAALLADAGEPDDDWACLTLDAAVAEPAVHQAQAALHARLLQRLQVPGPGTAGLGRGAAHAAWALLLGARTAAALAPSPAARAALLADCRRALARCCGQAIEPAGFHPLDARGRRGRWLGADAGRDDGLLLWAPEPPAWPPRPAWPGEALREAARRPAHPRHG